MREGEGGEVMSKWDASGSGSVMVERGSRGLSVREGEG
jgi:hypothetical protein